MGVAEAGSSGVVIITFMSIGHWTRRRRFLGPVSSCGTAEPNWPITPHLIISVSNAYDRMGT